MNKPGSWNNHPNRKSISKPTSDGIPTQLIGPLRLSAGALIENELKQPTLEPLTASQRSKLLFPVVAKFLLLWISFVGVLAALALLTDINWARPFLQKSLRESLHRNVQLGRLTWSFGLNGLAIDTKQIFISEPDGKPFLNAGESEIGIAVTPLFHKRLIIRHLQFGKPELWAVRTGPQRWNFSDLLEAGPEVRFIGCEEGTFHLVDQPISRKTVAWKELDLKDVKVSFVFPRKHRKTSVFVTFKLPRKGYTTGIEVTGLHQGKSTRWQDDRYDFDIKTQKLNPSDFIAFVGAVMPDFEGVAATVKTSVQSSTVSGKSGNEVTVSNSKTIETTASGQPAKEFAGAKNKTNRSTGIADAPLNPAFDPVEFHKRLSGLFDITLKGKGALSSGIDATLSANADNFSLTTPAVGTIAAPHAVSQCKLRLDEHTLQWREFSLRLADLALTSEGQFSDWSQTNSRYSAKIGGKLNDLKTAAKLISNSQAERGLEAAKDWTGKAEVEVQLLGDQTSSKCITSVKVEDLIAKNLLQKLPPEAKPLLSVLGFSEDAKLRGGLRIDPDESIEIQNAEIPFSVGNVKASGVISLKKNTSQFSFDGDNLQLNAVQQQLNEKLHNNHAGSAELPKSANLLLGGLFDLDGKFASDRNRVDSSGNMVLKNVQFGLSDKSLTTSGIAGQIIWQNENVELRNIKGKIGDGTFSLDGVSGLAANSKIDLQLHAQHAELDQLETVLRILKLDLPILTERQLYGRVKDLVLKVSGTHKEPQIYLSAVPEDLYYQPPGLTRPLRAKSGTIVYEKDKLTLSDIALAVRNDKVVLSVDIDNVSKAAAVRQVVLKTFGVELTDVDYYLSSVLMPPPLKKQYSQFLKSYKLKSVHGRISADLMCKINGDNAVLDGTTTLWNVGADVAGFPVDKLNGTATAAGDQLSLQSLSGSIRQSRFNIDGRINKYRDVDPLLGIQVTAIVDSRELVELIPALPVLVGQREKKVQLSAAGPLEFKAGLKGNVSDTHVWFVLKADPEDQLTVRTELGTFYQPYGERLSLNGSGQIGNSGIDLSKARLTLGDSIFAGHFGMKYVRIPNSPNNGIDLQNSPIDVEMKTESATDVLKVASLFDPSLLREDVKGTVSGSLAVSGTFSQPRPVGNLILQNVSCTGCDLHDLSGSLALQQFSSASNEAGHIKLSSMRVKNLIVKDVNADLSMVTSGNDLITELSNGTANVADGKVTLAGSLNWTSHKLSLRSTLTQVKVGLLSDVLFGHPGEISGLADGTFNVSSDGSSPKSFIGNLSGDGGLTLHGGTISRFGQLQAKITQANLLRQGLFGFNLNNLLQSVYPVRTGFYKNLDAKFAIDKGVLSITELRYNGDDMRLWGTGTANLNLDTLDIEIAGKIPRVTSSVLGGPVGEMSRVLTFQKMMNVVTMHQLEALPALPVLGELASNKPRTFSFKVIAPLDNPKLLAQSIEKSFHWLPSKPAASAHPLPGIQQ